jgi:hypothetical protein
MEVIEVISQYIDKVQNLIIVEFRMFGDADDVTREDFIEYSFFEEFGFDNSKDFDIFESILEDENEDDWEDDIDYINDEDNLISFLNEYYVVYPKKIPKAEYK